MFDLLIVNNLISNYITNNDKYKYEKLLKVIVYSTLVYY